MRLRRGFNRTVAAIVLAAAAVIVPCSAWYVMGSKAARADAEEIANEPLWHAYKVAMRMSERLGTRLETLRDAESRRPFYHYAQRYHDPSSNCECASMTPSPLSQGPIDALVLTHFQIDPSYRMSMPSLGDVDSSLPSGDGWFCEQQSVYAKLSAATLTCVEAIRGPSPFANATAKGNYDGSSCKLNPVLDGLVAFPALPPPSSPPKLKELEEFNWYTLSLGESPSLVGMRKAHTEGGDWIQGFVISFAGVKSLLEDSSYPASIHPARTGPSSPTAAEVELPIECVNWLVSVDPGESVYAAEEKATRIMASFHRTFAGGAVTAVLAALCMIGLVWQSDKLARQRSRFAASAAHELRTPLAGLRLYGEMLAEGLGDQTRSGEYAQRIAGEAERLGRVVSNVLGYSRLERGSLSVRPRPGDLAKAVNDCLDRLRPALQATGARLETQIDDLPQVRFDSDAVNHIVQNLVDNAEKYTRHCEDRTVHVALHRQDDGIELIVRDHGDGIPAGTQRHLFQAFARGEDPDAPTGLGLGLVLVHGLARAQGGRVRYQDAPGGGAQFSVTFPNWAT